MRKLIILLSIAAVISFFLGAAKSYAQDVIYTKDGSMYKGRVVEEVPNVRIIIQDMAGNRHAVSWDNIDRIQRGEWLGKKSATVSWSLSFFLLPGLGQFYNGDNLKGATMLVVAIGGSVVMLTSEDREAAGYGAVVYLVDWIWSFIDAPIRSSSINHDRGYSFAPDMQPYLSSPPATIGYQRRELTPIKIVTLKVRF